MQSQESNIIILYYAIVLNIIIVYDRIICICFKTFSSIFNCFMFECVRYVWCVQRHMYRRF